MKISIDDIIKERNKNKEQFTSKADKAFCQDRERFWACYTQYVKGFNYAVTLINERLNALSTPSAETHLIYTKFLLNKCDALLKSSGKNKIYILKHCAAVSTPCKLDEIQHIAKLQTRCMAFFKAILNDYITRVVTNTPAKEMKKLPPIHIQLISDYCNEFDIPPDEKVKGLYFLNQTEEEHDNPSPPPLSPSM